MTMKISILQWNVWFKESADNILRELERWDADIVCLQELTTHSAANPHRDIPSEIAALGYYPYFVQALHNDDTDMGNGIFSKFPLAGSRHMYVQHEDPKSADYSHENRLYLEAEIDVNNVPLTIGTVHLSYSQEFLSSEAKDTETNELLLAIQGNRTNFLLTGDLNALPGSYTVSKLGKLLTPVGPPYNEATWTTKPFSYNGFEAKTLEWRLDYVFTTPDVQIADSRILQTDSSDHLPILTTVNF